MNEQTKLSPEDAATLAALVSRSEILKRDGKIVELEMRVFQMRVHMAYGNPNEAIDIGEDYSLNRRPLNLPPEKPET